MRRRAAIITGSVVLVLLLAIVILRVVVAPMADPGLGFVAKIVCSDVFVGGMTPEQALATLPDEPIARLVRARVDRSAGTARAYVPLIVSREAVHREGAGCTLRPRDGTAPAPVEHVAAARPAAGPLPEQRDARVQAAVDAQFEEPHPDRPRRTRAVVVLRGGRVIGERYADGFDADTRFTGWSMTKSVTSALAGILVEQGRLDTTATALMPQWQAPDDPRRGISLLHLLHMSSGLAFRESYAPTGDATEMLFASRDVAAFAARSPLVHEPGTHWLYSSATTNIISYVIRRAVEAAGEDYMTFPRRALFDRIGMHSAVMEPDASGTLVGSSFMYATARDWARFGELFLRRGAWHGEQVVPESWVEWSARPAPASHTGEYGGHWWLNAGPPGDPARRRWPDLPADIYYAAGFQGQYVVVVPSHDMVVVRLGATSADGAWSLGTFLRELLKPVKPDAAPEFR